MVALKPLLLPNISQELLQGLFIRKIWCDWVKCGQLNKKWCSISHYADGHTISIRHCRRDKNDDWRPFGNRYCLQEIALTYEQEGSEQGFAGSECKIFVKINNSEEMRKLISW